MPFCRLISNPATIEVNSPPIAKLRGHNSLFDANVHKEIIQKFEKVPYTFRIVIPKPKGHISVKAKKGVITLVLDLVNQYEIESYSLESIRKKIKTDAVTKDFKPPLSSLMESKYSGFVFLHKFFDATTRNFIDEPFLAEEHPMVDTKDSKMFPLSPIRFDIISLAEDDTMFIHEVLDGFNQTELLFSLNSWAGRNKKIGTWGQFVSDALTLAALNVKQPIFVIPGTQTPHPIYEKNIRPQLEYWAKTILDYSVGHTIYL